VQLPPGADPAAQQWVLQRRANGYFTLRNGASGLVLAVRGASTQDGAVIEQAPAVAGSSSQEWAVVRQTDGTVLIVNRKSDKALEAQQWATTPGSAIDQWASGGGDERWAVPQVAVLGSAFDPLTPSGGRKQRWRLTRAGPR
jgi:hypothetical protein